jgi:hypothetical protein
MTTGHSPINLRELETVKKEEAKLKAELTQVGLICILKGSGLSHVLMSLN